jgi:hypothetical protein
MDVGTGLALLGSAQVLQKLLGPTADYVGEGAKGWAQRRVENVKRIFSKAAKKLGPRMEIPGSVPPRVLEGVVNNGSFCDDELVAEYFGGVLASSRSEESRDDRGSALNALIARMSTYQIRTHYIIYTVVRKLFAGKGLSLTYTDRQKMEVFLPFETYFDAMSFSQKELERFEALMEHVFFGLQRESLIEQSFMYGQGKDMTDRYPKAAGRGGVLYQPSVLGAELFLSVHGHAWTSVAQLLDPTSTFQIDAVLAVPDGAWPSKEESSA